jgi:hypothetical protein
VLILLPLPAPPVMGLMLPAWFLLLLLLGEGGVGKETAREHSGYGDGRTRSRSTDDEDAQGAGHAGRQAEPSHRVGQQGEARLQRRERGSVLRRSKAAESGRG